MIPKMESIYTPTRLHHPEPIDFSSPILDLCTRRRSPSPQSVEDNNNLRDEHPLAATESTSTCPITCSSPDSDNSGLSTLSNPYYDHQSSNANREKLPRPFKAYPKNPLSASTAVSPSIFDRTSMEQYTKYRQTVLAKFQATHNTTNKNMRRTSQSNSGNRHDPIYLEKRRKNNEAAKRSRDARRAKEDEIAIRAAFLEHENYRLRCELEMAKKELEGIKELMYGQNCHQMLGPYLQYNHSA